MDLISLSLALSLHIGFENEYNPLHPHIRYQNESIIAGAYINSESSISTYIGQRIERGEYGLEYGGVTGYRDAPLTPYIRGTYKNLFISPGFENSTMGIVLGTEIKF